MNHIMSQAIALFLSLTFVSVAANWALLRMGGFNATVPGLDRKRDRCEGGMGLTGWSLVGS